MSPSDLVTRRKTQNELLQSLQRVRQLKSVVDVDPLVDTANEAIRFFPFRVAELTRCVSHTT